MEKLTYPLVYYDLGPQLVLAVLPGTDYEVIDKDLKSAKLVLSAYLQKQYRKYDDYPYYNISEFRTKVFDIEVRLVHRDKDGRAFPLSQTIALALTVVYGQSERGHYECYVPLFKARFNYHEAKELGHLVQYFANNFFANKTPEEIYRLILSPQPKLDSVSLKVNPNRDFGYDFDFDDESKNKQLAQMAEPYPAQQKRQSGGLQFPETVWEREELIETLIEKLQLHKSNLILVGEASVGKSSLLKQAIRQMHSKDKRSPLFWQIMAQRITARAKYLGEWQEQVEDLVRELEQNRGVLWVLDLMQLLLIGGKGPEDSVAAFLTPFLQNGRIQLVGELSPTELERMRRLLPGFADNFQVLQVPKLSERKVETVLDRLAEYSRRNFRIEIEGAALKRLYQLLDRYMSYEAFPGKAVNFLRSCLNEVHSLKLDRVTVDTVIELFSRQTGLPSLFLRDEERLDVSELQGFFEQRIIGQPEAIDILVQLVKVFKAGLNNPAKPISTLLFAGPTGVGKTATAKALADYFFGKGQRRSPLVRIDMSEFQHPAQLARFIGHGNQPGKLVQDIREKPFSVLLLDEVEKADPSVFDALLGVLDEGILVDAFGRQTHFRNAIIIMTSNLGASSRQALGFGANQGPDYEAAIARFFRPEFVNRIDHILNFKALSQSDIEAITRKELAELGSREGFEKRGLSVDFGPRLIARLIAKGFDARYGARPLQRSIETELIAPLAHWLLKHPQVKQGKLSVELGETGKLEVIFQASA